MNQYTVLVIEDSETSNMLVRSLFEDMGYTVFAAHSAKKAFKSLEQELPDLIILDINLPDIDGFEVLKVLKADEKTKTIPVVVISAKDGIADIELAQQLGATDYVTKPIGINRLSERVEEIFHK